MIAGPEVRRSGFGSEGVGVVPGARQASILEILCQVVGEDSVSAPGSGAFDGDESGAVPSVVAFQVADPAFGAWAVSSFVDRCFVGQAAAAV